MNLPELKQNFYKRFDESDKFLHFTSCGILYTMLGHTDIDTAPSLTCPLSMRIQMFSRKMGTDMINLENTASNTCLSYRFGTPSELYREKDKYVASLINALSHYKISGAKILYDNSIPEFLPHTEPFLTALAQALLTVSGVSYSKEDIAASCSENANITECLALLYAKSGYGTVMTHGIPENVPLPFFGYKILSAHCVEKKKDRSARIKSAIEKMRRLYPHITSVHHITEEAVNASKNIIKDQTALRYLYHLATENTRIKTAKTALKRCNIKTLFIEMNKSQKSMERFWDLGIENLFLAHCSEGLDGVAAVRSWRNGIAAIVENDSVDYVIDMIRHKFESNIGYLPTFCVSDPF